MKHKKAQLMNITIQGIFVAFVEIVIFVALHPAIQNQIEILKDNSTSTAMNLMADLIPFFIILAIVIGTLSISTGPQQQQF